MSRRKQLVCGGALLVGLLLLAVAGMVTAGGAIAQAQTSSPTALTSAPSWLSVIAGVLGTLITALVSISVAAMQVASKISARVTKEVNDLRQHFTDKITHLEQALRADLAPKHVAEQVVSINAGLEQLAKLDPPSQRECRELHEANAEEHADLSQRVALLEATAEGDLARRLSSLEARLSKVVAG
jgi:hypothetical protein